MDKCIWKSILEKDNKMHDQLKIKLEEDIYNINKDAKALIKGIESIMEYGPNSILTYANYSYMQSIYREIGDRANKVADSIEMYNK